MARAGGTRSRDRVRGVSVLGRGLYAPDRRAETIASLLTSPEAVFAALFGWLFLEQVLSPRQIAGCALVFAAVVLTQVWSGDRG